MIKTFFWLISLASVAVIYLQGRQEHIMLQQQVERARHARAELEVLQREQLRLRKLADDATNAASSRSTAAAPHHLEASLLEHESSSRPVTPLEPGEWSPAGDWRDRGRESPRAAIETVLWAAAGGDLVRLKELIHLDDAARELASGILEHLPAPAQHLYSGPEHLMAAFTTRSVPLSEAQLVWEQQTGENSAMVCVFVRNLGPAAAPPSATPGLPTEDRPPPTGSPDFRTRAVYLSLEHEDGGWRVVVPAAAVQRIAAELGL